MRRHNAFPKPGDRIRLAVPLPTDTAEPDARYGTVLERSCGRSNALRVRWDREAGAQLAVDAGAEAWLADAGWYWDKAHLEVVDGHEAAPVENARPLRRSSSMEEESWLSATPAAVAPSGGLDGSLDAVAEWEAALASEIGGGAEASWEDMLASALNHGAPVAAPRAAAPAAEVVRRPPPAPPAPAAAPVEARHAPQPAMGHKDIRKRTPSPDARVEAEPEPEQAPAAAPVQGWKGDDILPTPRASGKRWGRR